MFWLAQAKNETLDKASELVRDITTFRVAQALIIIFITYWVIFSIEKLLIWLSEKAALRFRLTIKQSLPFWRAFCLTLAGIFLGNLLLNLSESNVLAVTGTVAVALGFAFKDYASSVIAGIIGLFERPYQVGDRVRVGNYYGEIVSYGLRGIKLRTPTNDVVMIPHNKLWTEAIVNANDGNVEIQVVTDFYLAHRVDLEKVMQILYRVAQTSKYTQIKLPIQVILDEQPWGTHFRLKCYPIDARDEFIYKTDLIKRTKQALQQMNVKYPSFPASEFELSFT
ncbi:MAG: mechanosensitive ion channel family protein [Oscillatoriales cyanobacterium RM2_1_1]|nr:mechanosensitive ion channel family protein [Oscillatoriales cyanobacterium SM2_3_0]NJO45358.1 mechanosensitive ion channel family protein [Oscillatoriales cyanobacterium RM2_1_1]